MMKIEILLLNLDISIIKALTVGRQISHLYLDKIRTM